MQKSAIEIEVSFGPGRHYKQTRVSMRGPFREIGVYVDGVYQETSENVNKVIKALNGLDWPVKIKVLRCAISRELKQGG